MTNLRIGQIVTEHANPLMKVSKGYAEVVERVAGLQFSDVHRELLACLVASQTEEQYKKYMVLVLQNLATVEKEAKSLVDLWQSNKLAIDDSAFVRLFTESEKELIAPKDFEDWLSDHPELFNDGFVMDFYPTMKKGMLYWRRLSRDYVQDYANLTNYQKLVLHFVTAQMLVSWESSCIDLGLMLLDDWELEPMVEGSTKSGLSTRLTLRHCFGAILVL